MESLLVKFSSYTHKINQFFESNMSYINSQTGEELTVEDVEREHDRLRELSKDMPPLIPIGDPISYGDEEDNDEEDNDCGKGIADMSYANYLFQYLHGDADLSSPNFDETFESMYYHAFKSRDLELFWLEMDESAIFKRLRVEFHSKYHQKMLDGFKRSLAHCKLKDENKRILDNAVATTVTLTETIVALRTEIAVLSLRNQELQDINATLLSSNLSA
jgi:hypothetical protein